MNETRYIISDAAKMIDVEPHVLRYWEEELGMEIPRNEMGHRYYTDKEVKIFTAVRDLKAKGFQLKAIKMVLSAIIGQASENNIISLEAIRNNIQSKNEGDKVKTEKTTEEVKQTSAAKTQVSEENIGKETTGKEMTAKETTAKAEETPHAVAEIKKQEISEDAMYLTAEEKMRHFKYMMDSMMLSALRKNNEIFADTLIEKISDKVIGEMDDLFRLQEEREDERFRDLDAMMRRKQRGRKEAAASGIGHRESRRGIFRKQKY